MGEEVRILTDQEIQSLIDDIKPIPSKTINGIRPQMKKERQHRECDTEIVSGSGNLFKIRVRVNENHPFDFSIILMYQDPQTNKWYILRKYNGSSHTHTNKIERTKLRGYHIHKATERYQQAGYNIEGYAEKTDSYSNWQDALGKMLHECNFKTKEEDLLNY
jgi:hypothetical protein